MQLLRMMAPDSPSISGGAAIFWFLMLRMGKLPARRRSQRLHRLAQGECGHEPDDHHDHHTHSHDALVTVLKDCQVVLAGGMDGGPPWT